MTTRHETCDVVVVGAGPGGATAASFVAARGHRVVLLERETPPLYKIGESLLPSTVHGICALLGVTAELKAAGFVEKRGGTFRWGRNKQPWTFAFAASSQFPATTAYAYQVERVKFDKILLDNARRRGVEVRERHAVTDVLVEDDRVAGVDATTDGGQRVHIHAKYVIDASGHSSVIARHAGERIYSTRFRNLAVFGYFLNGKRLPPPQSGNIFSIAFEKGWFWYIPLSATLTSVGAVIDQAHAPLLRKNKEAALLDLIGECPHVRDLLSEATRVTEGPYGEVRVRKDFSYCHTAFWRPGLALVGDAACFIDPLFSSGVHLATYSALLCARSINTVLANELSEAQAFTEFERRYRREYLLFHDFLVAFYDVDQDLDDYYWAARKVLNSNDDGRDAFIRLVGGMGGSAETLQADGEAIPLSALGKHLFPTAEAGGDLYEDGAVVPSHAPGAAAAPRDRFLAALTAESVQLRMQARRIPYASQPLFADGLVPSSDGLHWVVPGAA